MKHAILLALLALAACDDQPKQRVEQILPHKQVQRVAYVPVKQQPECVMSRHTIGSLFRASMKRDGTTPREIAAGALEQYQACGGR